MTSSSEQPEPRIQIRANAFWMARSAPPQVVPVVEDDEDDADQGP